MGSGEGLGVRPRRERNAETAATRSGGRGILPPRADAGRRPAPRGERAGGQRVGVRRGTERADQPEPSGCGDERPGAARNRRGAERALRVGGGLQRRHRVPAAPSRSCWAGTAAYGGGAGRSPRGQRRRGDRRECGRHPPSPTSTPVDQGSISVFRIGRRGVLTRLGKRVPTGGRQPDFGRMVLWPPVRPHARHNQSAASGGRAGPNSNWAGPARNQQTTAT